MLSLSEENYLKAVYHLSDGGNTEVNTNSISEYIQTRAASVTDMIKKLAAKGMVDYEKYHGLTITKEGATEALQIIRRHRLWEVFMVNKLEMDWDEVHDIAEQLEHIKSEMLTERLDQFLEYPKFDPHGDPIPDKNGKMSVFEKLPLLNADEGTEAMVIAVKNSEDTFLKYLNKIGITIGVRIYVCEKFEYDGSMELKVSDRTIQISGKTAQNILITKTND